MSYILMAVAIFIGDFIIKDYIDRNERLNKPRKILKDRVIIRKVYNEGIIFNLGEQKREFMAGLSTGVSIMVLLAYIRLLFKNGYHILKLGMTFIVGGGASNIYDKLVKHKVVDYFSINTKAGKLKNIIFNISDWFIFLGTLIIMIWQLFVKKSTD